MAANNKSRAVKDLYHHAYLLYDSKAYDKLLEACSQILTEYPNSKEARFALKNFPIVWDEVGKKLSLNESILELPLSNQLLMTNGNVQEEKYLKMIKDVLDPLWGGKKVLYFTNKRIILERSEYFGIREIFGSIIAALGFQLIRYGLVNLGIAFMIGGGGLLLSYAIKIHNRKSSIDTGIQKISTLGKKTYSINYDELQMIILKKKSIPIGYSQLKLVLEKKNLILSFKRNLFDDLSSLLLQLIPSKVEIK
jgi:hypothetical protein